MPPGKDENKPSCMGGRASPPQGDRPVSPPKESKDKRKLVRIGSRFFSKDVETTKRFNFGVEVGKSSSGIRVKSLNEVVSERYRTFKPVNKKLPTYPGEQPLPTVDEDSEGTTDLR